VSPQRALALECCRVVASEPLLLKTLFSTYDLRGTSSTFASFTSALCSTLRSPAVGFPQQADGQIEAQVRDRG